MARLREESDDYPRIVARLSEKWRLIVCRDGLQWILQRHREKGGQACWRSERYCRTKVGLKSVLTSFLIAQTAEIAALPERIGA